LTLKNGLKTLIVVNLVRTVPLAKFMCCC